MSVRGDRILGWGRADDESRVPLYWLVDGLYGPKLSKSYIIPFISHLVGYEVICLGKIAVYLLTSSRSKVIPSLSKVVSKHALVLKLMPASVATAS